MYESTPQAIIDEESHPGVLADMLNSSSSSDDSSSSDSTDSDTSGSGSVAQAGKKIKRVFKNRRRRKSSASTSSATGSATHSALSLPSTQERGGSHVGSSVASRRGSTVAALPSDNLDQDADTQHQPRVRDFGDDSFADGETTKSPERKKSRKKKVKKHHKKKHNRNGAIENSDNNDILGGPKVQSPATEKPPKTIGFADNVETGNQERTSTPSRLPFNMRQVSSRGNSSRPGLPSMLSNNVFVTPPPAPTPQARPNPVRAQPSSNRIRRTSSLPDRLNEQQSSNGGAYPPIVAASGPLPPFQHQRHAVSGDNAVNTTEADDEEEGPSLSRTAAVVLLLCSTALVAVCAEFMVDAIPEMIENSPQVSQAFIGLIILPIVGNAAEHVTAVVVASKNKMDLAIGVAVGSSIQIALFVTPVVVLLGWILDTNMSLYFNLFETISLFVTAFVVNFLVLDGRSNYLEGSLLIAAYVIIALGAFFYPDADHQSQAGGGA